MGQYLEKTAYIETIYKYMPTKLITTTTIIYSYHTWPEALLKSSCILARMCLKTNRWSFRESCSSSKRTSARLLLIKRKQNKQKIRSVEHGICPIAEFTSPFWIVRIVTEYRILFSVYVVMYMYCLKILSEYWNVTRLFRPLPRYRNF